VNPEEGRAQRFAPLVDTKAVTPAQTALALNLVTEVDLLRLKTIARLRARGLPPDVGWEDLLQEAFTRVIVGSRHCLEGVTMVAFLAGIMRSLRAEHWRRVHTRSSARQEIRIDQNEKGSREVADPSPSPERSVIAREELDRIERLFTADPVAMRIITGLIEGLSAQRIRSAAGLSKTEYDSARRRIRRTLLREGLTCEPK
jgi:RNA polymerase sigma-70 factor (ECF subfamily)